MKKLAAVAAVAIIAAGLNTKKVAAWSGNGNLPAADLGNLLAADSGTPPAADLGTLPVADLGNIDIQGVWDSNWPSDTLRQQDTFAVFQARGYIWLLKMNNNANLYLYTDSQADDNCGLYLPDWGGFGTAKVLYLDPVSLDVVGFEEDHGGDNWQDATNISYLNNVKTIDSISNQLASYTYAGGTYPTMTVH